MRLEAQLIFGPLLMNTSPKSSSFDPPQESEWHRSIAEAAYYIAQKRGFTGEHTLDDWLAAEQQVAKAISARRPHEHD